MSISLGFTILILLLHSQLYLWASPFFFFFFFFYIPSFISGLHHSFSSSSAFPALSLGFTILFLLLLPSRLYLWASPFFFSFFCIPSYISGLHHSYSSSAFPAISLGFTILLLFLLLHSQLYLWSSPFFFSFFCIPSYISGVHHSSSSSSMFPATSLGFTILLLLCSQSYLSGSPFWVRFLHKWPFSNLTTKVLRIHLRGWCMLGVFLLLALTCLGYEFQDLLSPCNGMHVCTD